METLKCTDGKDHEFDPGECEGKEYACSKCHLPYDTYTQVCNKIIIFKDHAQALINHTNGCDPEMFADALFDLMLSTHRTLQQNFIKSLAAFIDKMKDMDTDLRNEAAVKWCKEVSKVERCFPFI